MDCIRVPYNGARCIRIGDDCYHLIGIEQGYVDTIIVDDEYEDCEDCVKDITDPIDCSPEIPPEPESSLYPEHSCAPYEYPSSSVGPVESSSEGSYGESSSGSL